MNEIITVTGKGKISLPPDTIIINISLHFYCDFITLQLYLQAIS